MSGGAVIIRRQNLYISAFMQAGATNPDNAKTLEELYCRESFIFERMVKFGVFVRLDSKRYYLSVEKAKEFAVKRRNMVLAILIGLCAIAAIMNFTALINK
ncbi:MAG: hypothetical protein ACOZCL_11130 [Bacillota bacterium]